MNTTKIPLRAALTLLLTTATTHAAILNHSTSQPLPNTQNITPAPNIDLSNWNTPTKNLEYATLNTNLKNANFKNSDLTDAYFQSAILTNANFKNTLIAGANFSDSNLTTAQLTSTASYAEHNLANINLSSITLANINLSSQNLTSANFQNSQLLSADFSNANLTDASLSTPQNYFYYDPFPIFWGPITLFPGTPLTLNAQNLVSLQPITLLPSNPISYFAPSPPANFSKANFTNANLTSADLSYSNFTAANFTSATLIDAKLSGANLTNANFTAANLAGADFSTPIYDIVGIVSEPGQIYADNSASLISSTATLSSAFTHSTTTLSGTNFSDADLRGAIAFTPASTTVTKNTILPTGHINALSLAASEKLIIRNNPLPITVDTKATFNPRSTLEFLLSPDWTSTISFSNNLTPSLAGTLDLQLAPDIDPASLVGDTFTLFNWNTKLPASDHFNNLLTDLRLTFDLSNLYTTGTITITNAKSSAPSFTPFTSLTLATTPTPEPTTLLTLTPTLLLLRRPKTPAPKIS